MDEDGEDSEDGEPDEMVSVTSTILSLSFVGEFVIVETRVVALAELPVELDVMWLCVEESEYEESIVDRATRESEDVEYCRVEESVSPEENDEVDESSDVEDSYFSVDSADVDRA